MKNVIRFFAAALATLVFVSCSQEPIYLDASGNGVSEPAMYVSNASEGGMSKGGMVAQPAPASTPVVAVQPKHSCTQCGSWFCAKPDCCDVISNEVLSRATAQGGTGEPQIGLIPTMKTLAPEL